VFDPYTSFALYESSKDTIGDPRESWVEKSRLPSFSEFLGGMFFSEQTPRIHLVGVVPVA